MKYSYYPGCCLETSAKAYERANQAVALALGIEFVEVPDWNCCAATELVSLSLTAAYATIARNLAQATKNQGIKDVVCPCSMCYVNMAKTDLYMADSPKLAKNVNTALAEAGLAYEPGTLRVRNLVQVLMNDIGLDQIAAQVKKPLKGLKVASYYGCLQGRPRLTGEEDDAENPVLLDEMMAALGAEPVNFPLKAQCCGGHMTQLNQDTGYAMIYRILKSAADNGADLIATPCPMCQMNLDAFQGPVNRHMKSSVKMPVIYMTQLMGLAFGMDAKALGFGDELVSAAPALAKIGVQAPPPAEPPKPAARKRDDKTLPMPKRLEKREVA